MRLRILSLILLLSLPAAAGTWTFNHGARGAACTGGVSTCSQTLAFTPTGGAHDVLVITVATTSTAAITILSSSTLGSTNLTLVPGSACAVFVAGSAEQMDCAYILNPPTATNLTVNISLNAPANWFIGAIDISNSVAACYDTAGALSGSTSTTPQSGPALTLSGTNDFIVQSIKPGSVPTAVSGSYADAYASLSQNLSSAYLLNTGSGAAVSWTLTGNAKAALNAIAFKDTGCGSVTAQFPLLGVGL